MTKPKSNLKTLGMIMLTLWSLLSHAAGFRFIEVPASAAGPALRGAVWTPCAETPVAIDFPSTAIQGTKDCPIAGSRLPLVVISHGHSGTFLSHHDTAAALANAGFVVAAISHSGDSFSDLSRQGELSVFATRPAEMKRLVDFMLTQWSGRSKVNADEIGIFGFSRGGYTALAALGAEPNWTLRKDLCPPGSQMPLCGDIRRNAIQSNPVPDARIKAAVVVDPLSVFDAHALRQVRAPIQLWASEFGGDGVTFEHVAQLRKDLSNPPDWLIAKQATHFAFLAPCSPTLASLVPEICTDRSGFDRAAFHDEFNAQVTTFFKRHLQSIQ